MNNETKTTQELQSLMTDIEDRLVGKTILLAICDDATGDYAAAMGGSALLLSYLIVAVMTIIEGEQTTDVCENNGNAPSVRTIQ